MSNSWMVELPVTPAGRVEPCCPPLASAELSQADAEKMAAMFKKLREAGLLASERRGTWVYYWVEPAVIAGMAALLGSPD
ncbi:ArsR/SmtB family transcription factor [Streptomyces cyaneofuscatus]|uniref:ArsR/SmtB family transcription factor n=1 Tax=Streptomyces cyaneofuscatus TaxID=66883 RepID=UPI00364EAFC6